MATTPNALFTGSLIGDVLIQARETVPDMPPFLPAPIASFAVTTPGTGTLSAGTYFLIVTQWNQWGETLGSTESSVQTVASTNGIQVTSALQVGATKIRAYLTQVNGAAGTESQYVESTTSPFTILANPVNAGSPPVRGTAWLPDSDGGFISVGAIYRWLNAGLEMIARGTGGFQDYSAIGSTINQPLYEIPANWNAINNIWYDGYWMTGGDPGYFWRRNSITSQVLSKAHVSHQGSRTVLEVYPQPARTSVTTTLSSQMSATDTTAALTNSGFTLPFGFVSVGSEIMAYATISGSNLTGLIRGLGGTGAIAHTTSEAVIECNIAWMGKRQSSQAYAPGQSTTLLPIPNGWDQLLVQYLAGRAKIVEHDFQSMQAFNAEMEKAIKGWAQTTQGVVRRRQVGGSGGPAVYFPDQAGGLILPAITPVATMLYSVIENVSRCHYNGGHGGLLAWLTLSTFCATLVPTLSGMWEKLKTLLREKKLTHLLRKYADRESEKSSGRPNFVRSACALFSKLLRNVKQENGKNAKSFGLRTMDSKISSTLDLTQLLGISMPAVRAREKSYGELFLNNSPTPLEDKITKRRCVDGQPISRIRNAWCYRLAEKWRPVARLS